MTWISRVTTCVVAGLVLTAGTVGVGQVRVETSGAVFSPEGELLEELTEPILSPDGQAVVFSVQADPQRGRLEPQGTAVLGGRVVAAGTGAPIREAEVSLEAADRRVRRSTLTDADGRYAFERLPGGEYTVRVEKPGYIRLAYGQRDAFGRGTPVVLAAGARADSVNFAVPRGSVITVRVTDDGGEPVAGAVVRVQQFEYRPDGQRQLTGVQPGSMFGATNDRGEFRAYGLMPGEYVVGARLGADEAPPANGIVPTEDGSAPGAGNRLAPTYYPGTINLERATPISVGVGEETVVALAMVAARLGLIAGTVVDSHGQPAAGAQLRVVTHLATTVLPNPNAGRVANDGTFSIAGLPPGEHVLTVRTAAGRRGQPLRIVEQREALRADADGQLVLSAPVQMFTLPGDGDREREFASVPVVVSGDDVTGLYIVTQPGIDVSGTVVVPAGATRPPRVRVRAEALGDTGSGATGRPLEDAAFELTGLAGRVFVDAILPNGWAVASVTLGGRDITDEPLDLTGRTSLSGIVVALTNDPARISGRVTDDAGQPLRDYVVVVQPAELLGSPEATNRRVRAVRPDGQGRFETSGLRPGRYLATAIPALQEGREYSPELRERLRPTARELVIGPGDDRRLDLPITRGL